MDKTISNRSYYPALDGLRGIAILAVVLFHCFGFIPIFKYGWLGVDLFFVLSGFLITEILLRTKESNNYFKNFYMRRVLRIFPLYYLSLIIVIIILPSIKTFPFDISYYKEHQVWYWFYLENWLMVIEKWESRPYIFNHYWSLAVEEQYYIIWPFIVYLFKNTKRLFWLCFALLLFMISIRIYIWCNQHSFPLYQNIFKFTRFDGILVGSMLALINKIEVSFLKKYSYLIILGIIGLNLFYFFLRETRFSFPYWATIGYPTNAILFAILIHKATCEKNKLLNFVLTISPLKFLGKISYGIYIFHWPIYLLLYPHVEELAITTFNVNGLALKVIVSSLLVIIGLLTSIISYYTYESFWLRLKNRYH